MKTINPDWVAKIKTVANPCPYFTLQQMRIREVSWGASVIEIELDTRHLQPFGLVHGGVFATLIDAASFWAVYSKADPKVGMTTVDLNINYLAPAKSGLLIGKGRCIKLGRNLGLGDARVENEAGQLLAHGKTTVMIQDEMKLPAEVGRIPKYISA